MAKKIKTEEWSEITGFHDYYISVFGEVYSGRSNKILKKNFRNGYYYITLYNDERKIHKYIHRLVAEAFISNEEKYPMINHIDENRTNNQIDNLEWCTSEYNVNYGSGKEKRAKSSSERHKKPVIAYKNQQIILADSINEMANKIKSYPGNISHVLHGRQKTTRGYFIEYYNSEVFEREEV